MNHDTQWCMPKFKLDEKLKADLTLIGKLQLCQVFLHPNSDNPWVVLVPERPDISEWHQLKSNDQALLNKELSSVSIALEKLFQPTKINIGALGNIVRQLHIHVIARYETDAAWPGPIWGTELQSDAQKFKQINALIIKELF